MGTIIPDPFEPPDVPAGSTCLNCWGLGKPFSGRDTPDSIIVNFSGINKDSGWDPSKPVPFDAEYTLQQSIFVPCEFLLVEPGLNVFVRFDILETLVSWTVDAVGDFFRGFNNSPCLELVENLSTFRYVGGTCKIILPGTV